MDAQNVLAWILLVVAYVAVIPGWTAPLFSAKVQIFGMVVADLQKSTFSSIHMLLEQSGWFPAAIITFFSVLMPIIKLGAMLYLALVRGDEMSMASRARLLDAVRKVSKWQMVDVFLATILVGFLSGQSVITVDLHSGYYYFLAYCLLSTAGAQLLWIPGKDEPEAAAEVAGQKRSNLMLVGIFLAASVLVAICILTPLMTLEKTSFIQGAELSAMGLAARLLGRKEAAPTIVVSLFVVLFPMLHVVLSIARPGGEAQSTVLKWLRDFAMLDVFALSLLVVDLAASGVNPEFKLHMHAGGWLFCVAAIPFIAEAWFLTKAPSKEDVSETTSLTA